MADRALTSRRSPAHAPGSWSWKVVEISGIAVSVHATFLILVAWFVVAFWIEVGSVARVLEGVALLLLLFGCVLLHELGHALTAQRLGFITREITLLPIGGVARLEEIPDDPKQSLWITLAGPAVNIVIAAALFVVLRLTGTWRPIADIGLTTGPFIERLMLANTTLVIFNMLPAFPMDGGRALRALLATHLDDRRATRIAARLGQAMAALFALVGWIGNPFLILIALFVWTGAAQEVVMADIRGALSGITVGRVMLTAFRSLTTDDTLSTAIDLLQHGGQHDFPVTQNGELVGLLTSGNLLAVLRARGPHARVADAMQRDFLTVDPREMVDRTLSRLDAHQRSTAAVMQDGRLIGLFTADSVADFLSFQVARNHAA